MKVRSGVKEDATKILEMAATFWQHTIYNETFNAETTQKIVEHCIDQGLLVVLEAAGKVVGFCAGTKGGLIGNTEVVTGTELAWWVEPEHRGGRGGVALLAEMENAARRAGIKHWNMVYMESSMPEQVKKIYESLGYKRTEVVYSKVLEV